MQLVKGSTSYTLPDYASVTQFDLSVRNDNTDRADQHGGVMTGDGKVDTRTIEIEVIIADTTTTAEYRAIVDALKRYAYRTDQKLYIDDDRYVNLASLSKIAETFFDGFYRVRGTITLTFTCTDPFIYSDSVTTQNVTISSSPTSFIVTNTGNVDVPVILTMTATAANASMTIVNTTDNSRTFGYQDTGFTAGKVVTVDGIEGTVMRDRSSTINATGGTFINLLPGDNVLTYTGAACTIAVVYTERWL